MMMMYWRWKTREHAKIFESREMSSGGQRDGGGMEDVQGLDLSDTYHRMRGTLVE